MCFTLSVPRPLVHLVCGGVGGCAGTLASFPLDVVRTRLVAQRARVYTGTRHAVASLHAEAGLAAFYRGLVPACLREIILSTCSYKRLFSGPASFISINIKRLKVVVCSVAPQSGLQFGLYSLLTQLLGPWVTSPGSRAMSTQGSLACGGLAGLATKTVLYPLDVVKKRLQVSGWAEGRAGLGHTHSVTSGSMAACVRSLVAREGAR